MRTGWRALRCSKASCGVNTRPASFATSFSLMRRCLARPVGARVLRERLKGISGLSTFHDDADVPAWSYAEDSAADPALNSQDMSALQLIMWNFVGLVRTKHRLACSLRQLRELESET